MQRWKMSKTEGKSESECAVKGGSECDREQEIECDREQESRSKGNVVANMLS